MRFIGATTLALACAFGLAAQAQEATTRTETKVKTDDAKTLTFSGCVKPGTEAKAFILEKAVPIRKTTTEEATGTSGVVTTTTSTTYALVPGESVELTGDVGHKVEVTGVMVGGETRETKTTRESASGTRTEETVKQGALPQFRVISVKHLPETCS
jgi:hypothetical protein